MLPMMSAREGLLFIRTEPRCLGSSLWPVVTHLAGLSPELWCQQRSPLGTGCAGLGEQPCSGDVSARPWRRLVVACVAWMQESYWETLHPV